VADITVTLTQNEYKRLTKSTTGTGGLQVLIHRLQRGLRKGPGKTWLLTVTEADLKRIPRYWQGTGGRAGRGGYQSRLPVRALAKYLPSVAPLFNDGSVVHVVKPWVYFKRQKLGGDGRIKIGTGGERRARGGYHTDNPDELVVLLRLRATDDKDERYYHRTFSRLRIHSGQEWFWPGAELLAFIHEASAEQKLSEQRRGDDAAMARRDACAKPSTERAYS
jgi:hypothetical protein